MKSIYLLSVLLFVGPVASQELNSHDQKALDQTLELLRSKPLRDKAVKETKGAETANTNALGIAGSEENLDGMYELSAELFEVLLKSHNGDAEKLKASLLKYQSDPEALLKIIYADPKMKLKIQNIEKSMETNRSLAEQKK